MGALGVGFGAAWVITAVDGRPLFPCGSPAALPLHTPGGQWRSDEQRLLLMGQMKRGLAVGVVAEKGGVGIKVGGVAIVLKVGVHSLWWDESVVRDGYYGDGLLRIV